MIADALFSHYGQRQNSFRGEMVKKRRNTVHNRIHYMIIEDVLRVAVNPLIATLKPQSNGPS